MSAAEAILHYSVLDTAPEEQYDDVVALAAQLCDTPTALVSLLDVDRQWFKARVGFPCDETDLDRSVCRHVVAEADTIVIPDLTADPRTAFNPLVTGDPHIRFYAGAPLATRYGVVGALCVIDTAPRPQGLTSRQQEGLERLARQVVALLEARRDASDLAAALAAHQVSSAEATRTDRRWRDLYHRMDQGFIYARVLRDDAGAIRDWRYEDVNAAWGKLVGIDPDTARGRTLREMIPGVEDEWVMELACVVETHEPVHFTRQVGALDRWYDGIAQWVGDDDFTVIFQEVTDRVGSERRRDTLLAIGDMLRDETDVAEMTRRAAGMVGTVLGASRAAYGDLNHARETIVVEAGWALPDMPAIEGEHRFADYGSFLPGLLAGNLLVVEDVRTDPRTASDADNWARLNARSVVNVPVRDRGRIVALFIVQRSEPYAWSTDELAFIQNAADRLEIAIARRRAELRQDVLNGEIAHRLKNTLAMVQAVASQTLRKSSDPEEMEGFMRRLQALGTAHDALTAGQWEAADIKPVILGALTALGLEQRCRIEGPAVAMGARAALSTSLLIHELATNALKYGALMRDEGVVTVDWRVEGETDAHLILEWIERGGPEAVEPARKGFGSKLVKLGLVGTGGSAVRYTPSGLEATFTARVEEVGQA